MLLKGDVAICASRQKVWIFLAVRFRQYVQGEKS
jgi:hypothetical protein